MINFHCKLTELFFVAQHDLIAGRAEPTINLKGTGSPFSSKSQFQLTMEHEHIPGLDHEKRATPTQPEQPSGIKEEQHTEPFFQWDTFISFRGLTNGC